MSDSICVSHTSLIVNSVRHLESNKRKSVCLNAVAAGLRAYM